MLAVTAKKGRSGCTSSTRSIAVFSKEPKRRLRVQTRKTFSADLQRRCTFVPEGSRKAEFSDFIYTRFNSRAGFWRKTDYQACHHSETL